MTGKFRSEGPKPIFPKLITEEEQVKADPIEREVTVSAVEDEPVQPIEESKALTKDDLVHGFKMSVIIGEPRGRRGLQAFLKRK